MLSNLLLVVHLIVAVTIVALVLLQQGKGSDMGAAFGGGSSQSLFGARGSANFLSRSTSLLVALFFLSSMTLAYLYTHQNESTSVIFESADLNSSLPSADTSSQDAEQPTVSISGTPTESDIPAVPAETDTLEQSTPTTSETTN